jgi:hypothetical protein
MTKSTALPLSSTSTEARSVAPSTDAATSPAERVAATTADSVPLALSDTARVRACTKSSPAAVSPALSAARTLATSVPVAVSLEKIPASSEEASFATPVSGTTIDFPATPSDVEPASLTDVVTARDASSKYVPPSLAPVVTAVDAPSFPAATSDEMRDAATTALSEATGVSPTVSAAVVLAVSVPVAVSLGIVRLNVRTVSTADPTSATTGEATSDTASAEVAVSEVDVMTVGKAFWS